MAASRTLRTKWLVRMWAAAVVVLLASIGGTAAQPNPTKTIMILHSYDRNFEPGALWSKEIRNQLSRQAPWPLEFREQSLETAVKGNDAADVEFVEYLAALYAKQPPDLIIALGAAAARFVQRHRAGLFPTTAMLLAAVEMRRVEPSMLTPQDAVVGVRFDQVALIENILRLLPETKTIAIIIGNTANERFWVAEQKRILGPLLKDKVKLIFCNEWPFADILMAVGSLPPHSAILFQQLWMDGAGAVYGDKEPLRRISEVANAPIFSFDLSHFNGEVVGGPMFSPAEGARPTAAAAIRMLEGKKGSDIKVPPIEFSAPKYDWRQLQRWDISESRLPPGSEVWFREPTIWQRYSWQMALITVVILWQGALIAALMREHRQRQLAEMQSRQRMTELARVMRFSTAGELTASIAHEINQPLGSILTNAETAEEILKSSSPDITELREIVSDILRDDRRATDVIDRMRSLLKKAPFEQKKIDLNEVARETITFFSSLAVGRKFELVSMITPESLPILGDHIQLQQVILNLVVNSIDAMRDTPSENRIISIRTVRVDNFARLTVSDRGSGIPEEKLKEIFEPFFSSKAKGMGMGLSIARTIVEAHQGAISARNRKHGGASLQIKLPLCIDNAESAWLSHAL